jgi:2-haloacid dehalogenase
MSSKRNLIFDLGGVLFEHNRGESAAHQLFAPLEKGLELFEKCVQHAHADGHSLYVCSNWSLPYISMLESEYPEIFKSFHGIVTPSTALAKKPNPAIFTYLLSTYQLNPEHSIFIDDQLVNVEVARSLGITGIHSFDYDHVAQELSRLGIFKAV